MKYKVGDTVTIRKDLEAGKWYGKCTLNSSGKMNKYLGKQATITEADEKYYGLDIDNNYWSWTDEMFEEEPKTYYGDEILKMIREGKLKDGNVLIDKEGDKTSINYFKFHSIYTITKYEPYTIVEKEYMTFDAARKLGIPKHKDLGFQLSGTNYGMQQFIRDMDQKVWEAIK